MNPPKTKRANLPAQSMSMSTVVPRRKKRARLPRVLGALVGLGGTLWAYDHYFKADALQRSARTVMTGIAIAVDYKWNFSPQKVDAIDAMHARVAHRLHHLCVTNAGLYIKLGQALGMQAAVLPKVYGEAFANIFDAAPPISYEEVQGVFCKEFGMTPDDMFAEFDRHPLAAASIAQVHKAKTRDGRVVAVKVQRPAIEKQIDWDLFSFKLLMHAYEYIFDIPCVWMADYTAEQMRLETSFRTEGRNAERSAKNMASEPRLSSRVTIPRVHWDLTSERVMTADYAENACRIDNVAQIEAWGLSTGEVIKTTTEALAAMIFKFGWVHADPHVANVLVRPNKKHPKHAEIIFIDHGLYVELSDAFRKDYSELWKSLIMMDTETVDRIATNWGFGNSDLFASATLLKPFRISRKKSAEQDATHHIDPKSFEAQQSVKERFKSMLQNEQLIPRELIFVSRCLRMNQAANQIVGSPVNRINIIAHWAAEGLADTAAYGGTATRQPSTLRHQTRFRFGAWLREKVQLWRYRLTLILIDLGFLLTRLRQIVLRRPEEGFEDILQRQITEMARQDFGIELDERAWTG